MASGAFPARGAARLPLRGPCPRSFPRRRGSSGTRSGRTACAPCARGRTGRGAARRLKLPRALRRRRGARRRRRGVAVSRAPRPNSSVPVDALEPLKRGGIRTERRLSEEPRETNDLRGEEARGVADELVDDVGLRRVERHAVVPDVLRREEHAASERTEEASRGDQSPHGQHVDARALRELLVDCDELRDLAAVEVELGGRFPPLADAQPLVERGEVLPDAPPDRVLLVRTERRSGPDLPSRYWNARRAMALRRSRGRRVAEARVGVGVAPPANGRWAFDIPGVAGSAAGKKSFHRGGHLPDCDPAPAVPRGPRTFQGILSQADASPKVSGG